MGAPKGVLDLANTGTESAFFFIPFEVRTLTTFNILALFLFIAVVVVTVVVAVVVVSFYFSNDSLHDPFKIGPGHFVTENHWMQI